MSVTTADLVGSVRQKANVERSRFVSDSEILGFCNDAIADLWDTVTNSREGYFSKSATFQLSGGSNSIGIAQAVTGIAPDPDFPVSSPMLGPRVVLQPPGPVFSFTVGTSTAKQFFAVGGTTSFATPQLSFKPPAGRVLQLGLTPSTAVGAGGCSVQVYKNGQPTSIALFISGGATGAQNFDETNWTEPLYFSGEETMDLMIQETTAHSAWNFECETIYLLEQPQGDFLKELAFSYMRGSELVEINRLPTLADRGRVGLPHFWIAGNTIGFYPMTNLPTGVITLDYEPSAPVMSSDDVLPAELDRFRDFIELGACIAIKAKRGMTEDVASFTAKQNGVRARVIASLGHRKRGPRTIPMTDKDRACTVPFYRYGRLQ